MKIIILAGGEGKRMWPIQTDKCLIPFLGQPLLYRNLKQIKENTQDAEFVIIGNPNNKEKIGEIASNLGLNFNTTIQNEPKGMADALLSAKEYLEGEILILNAEDVLDPAIYQGVLGIKEADIVVAGRKTDKYFPGGYIENVKDQNSKVKSIVEKPGEGNEPSNLVKLVADYFKDGKKLAEYLEKASSSVDDVYETALNQMISSGLNVKFFGYDGAWIPLKYPWHILDIMAHLLSKTGQNISNEAKISDKAIIEGNVVIESGVKVFEGAVIKGPCYIGKNCIVGNNSMVRESDLEEGCVTGFNSDITRSYIGANSWFHSNYVGDSILEGDFGMGSCAVLANLRLDDHTIQVGENPSTSSGQERIDTGRHKLGLIAGSGARIGVNASTMPGSQIGSNSLVGPGVVLNEDIKENTKIILKQEYEISEHSPKLTSYEQFRDKLK